MYNEHNPKIAAAMRADPYIFARGCLFAIASIRQPITAVPAQLEEIDEKGPKAKALFGHKRAAYDYVMKHRADLLSSILAAPDNAARLALLCNVPGLGIVKSAFILQLLGYDVACLDSRNVKREGRNARAFREPYTRNKIAQYLFETEGRAAYYWDAWCSEVAGYYDLTPLAVSALHLCIVPEESVPF